MTITSTEGNAGGSIIIEDFNLDEAKKTGYLGLRLADKGGVGAGTRDAQSAKKVGWLDDAVAAAKGVLQTFTVYAPKISDQPQSAQVDIMGNFTGGINIGDGYMAYTGSPLTLTIPAGEDSITVALVNTGDPSKDVSVQLSAEFQDAASGETVSSNTLTVNFQGDGNTSDNNTPSSDTPTTPDRTIKGDLEAVNFGTDEKPEYHYDDLENLIVSANAAPGKNDRLNGSAGNDSINAGDGDNYINASSGGNDTISAGSGNDTVLAGGGNNVINVGAGQNRVTAGGGNNQVKVEGGDGVIKLGNGKNKITANGGDFNITLGDGKNTIDYQKSNVRITLGDGNNAIKGGGGGKVGETLRQQYYITGGKGNNTIEGGNDVGIVILGDGNNQVYADKKTDLADAIQNAGRGQGTGDYGNVIAVGNGNNTIVGGNGNDVIVSGGGNNLIILGPGNDTFSGGYTVSSVDRNWYTSLDGHTVMVHQVGKDPANTYTPNAEWSTSEYNRDVTTGKPAGTSNDTIFGGAGNSYIFTSNGDNYVDAGPGNTTVKGGGGNDTIFGGDGNGDLNGGGGDDYIDAEGGSHYVTGDDGNNIIYGGSGDDTIYAGDDGENWNSSATGSNYVQGGSGKQLIYGSGGQDTLMAGTGDTTIVGGSGSEYIVGGNGDNVLYSNSGTGTEGAGSTTIAAGSGNTTIYGGQGHDLIYGGDGIDVIYGGSGDTEIYAGDGGTADQATTVVVGSGNTTVHGGSGYLQVQGGSGNDMLIAGDGDSTLTGGSGVEQLYGGAGRSVLIGGSGSDTLYSGQGQTTMQGGSGYTVYEIDADAGDVLIEPSNATDVLRFGAGIGPQDLSITADLNSEVGATLYIVLPDGGTVSIEGGLAGAINSFQFADSGEIIDLKSLMQLADTYGTDVQGDNGDLVFSAADGDVITGTSGGNDTLAAYGANSTLVGGTGNETFLVHDSSEVIQAQAGSSNVVRTTVDYTAPENVQTLTAAGHGNITLSAKDGYDQTLVANDGNDTLIGAAGHDTLVGGAGRDTFVLGKATGDSLAINNSALGATVQLQPGLVLSDLSAARVDHDLVLQIDGAPASMRLKDYFTSDKSWTIKDSQGNVANPTGLILSTNQADVQPDTLWSVFSRAIRNDISQTLAGEGWTQQSNGLWTTGHVVAPLYGYSIITATTTVTSYQSANDSYRYSFNSGPSYTASFQPFSSLTLWSQGQTSITAVTSRLDDDVIYADAATQSMSSLQNGWFGLNWTPSYSYSYSTTASSDPTPWRNSLDELFYRSVTTTVSNYITYGMANVVGFSQTPLPVKYPSNGLPTAYTGTYVENDVVDEIQKIQLGAGVQTVYANQNTMVVGGTGNSRVYDAGLVYVSTGNNQIYNAQTAYGGDGQDLMVGGGTLIAGSGQETLMGGSAMVAGTGFDEIYAGTGDAVIRINALDSGSAVIGGDGDTDAFYTAYYQSLGIENWRVHRDYPGMYWLHMSDAGSGVFDNAQDLMARFNGWGVTLQQVLDRGWAEYLAPLPPIPQVLANDFAALEPYRAQGLLPQHTVKFGPGITENDLRLSWGRMAGTINGKSTATPSFYTTLNITWGDGQQSVSVLLPHSDDPLGSGVSSFNFANGITLSIRQMIALAPPAPTLDPQIFVYQQGMGVQHLGAGYSTVQFGAGITSDMITLGVGSLMLRVGDSGDVIHIEGFDPKHAEDFNQIANFSFADGTSLSYQQILQRGFDIYGTNGDDVLTGTDLNNRIHAGSGNDTLIGSGANDTLIAGSGNVTMIGGLGNETFIVNRQDDVIIANPDAASNTVLSDISYVLPDNVRNLTLTGNADLTAQGNALDNVITGNAGYDTLIAGVGNDVLIAGTGGGAMIGGEGVNTFVVGLGSGQQTVIDTLKTTGDTVQFGAGITLTDMHFVLQGTDLQVQYGSQGDSLLIQGFAPNGPTGEETIAHFQFEDGAQGRYVNSGDGTARLDAATSDGSLIEDFYQNADGSWGNDVREADGSWSGSWYGVNGAHTHYTQDAAGNFLERDYSASGALVGDNWEHVDGTSGMDTYNADGSSSGTTYLAGGGHTSYTNDGHGNAVTQRFDVQNELISDQLNNADGSSISDVYDPGTSELLSSTITPGSSGGGTLYGKTGANTFVLDVGAGQNVIDDSAALLVNGGDTISFGPGITAQDVKLAQQGDDLLLSYSASDSVLIKNFDLYGVNSTDLIGSLKFADGSSISVLTGDAWDGAGSYGLLYLNAQGKETMDSWAYSEGSYGTETYDPTSGNMMAATIGTTATTGQTLYGNWFGSTTFELALGNGQLVIDDQAAANAQRSDVLQFGAGISAGDINVSQQGADVLLSYSANDSVLIKNFDLYGADSMDLIGSLKFADGSSISVLTGNAWDGAGSYGLVYYDAQGRKTKDQWAYTDGTWGGDTYNANGSTESLVHQYNSSDGSSSTTDTLTQADGSYQQVWARSDGTSGSINVVGGVTQGDSWSLADGQQGVDAEGKQLLLGSANDDLTTAGDGDALIAGKAGNDTIALGAGADIVAFNLGDGHDTVLAGAGTTDAISLGGNFAYSDLAFEHVGNDLVLDVGGNDSVTFKDWYANPANQNFVTLQVIAAAMSDYAPGSNDVLRNASVQSFDLKTLVSEFDAAQTANPSTSPWGLTFGLLDAHLAASNDAALGGELAYGYGKNGTLSGTDVLLAQSTLSTANFGSMAQPIQPVSQPNGIAKIA